MIANQDIPAITAKKVWKILEQFERNLYTYQCQSREGEVRAMGGDLMPETIPMSGF